MLPVAQVDKNAVKHVSRACLECRSRHLKCGGQEPICERCSRHNRNCQYVKSNRGGSRKKGVSIKKKNTDTYNNKSSLLPCVKNGLDHLTDDPNCNAQCLNHDSFNKIPPCMKSAHNNNNNNNKVNFHPVFNESREEDSIDIIFDPSKLSPSLEQCYISPALVSNLDIESIVSTFYSTFYNSHPFLPPRPYIMEYLNSIPNNTDLLLAMKIISDGQATNMYFRDVETVNFLVTSLVDYVKQIGKDFISLQTLLLLSMITHISSLHDLSKLLRETLISLLYELKLNLVDQLNIPPIFIDVNGFITESSNSQIHNNNNNGKSIPNNQPNILSTPTDSDMKESLGDLFQSRRVLNIPKDVLVDTIRRTFWEIYFFDTISGTASGHTMSELATKKCLVLYPTTASFNEFDYKSRAESCKLVNDAIKLNVAIQSNKEVQPYLTHMRAAIGNWEMKMENPDMYGTPYLINSNGTVNEGVFESVMLVNYAKIFTHRPFSYLWRPDISKHPKCTDEEGVADNCQTLKKQEVDSRKIIETRKTIESANSVVKALLDTNPAKVLSRTPFLACALAFSCLVHLSAYSWVESSLLVLSDRSNLEIESLRASINEEELEIYTEYIKLEIGAIYQISRHWSLSAKLIQHIKETLLKVSPKLYKKVQSGLPYLGRDLTETRRNSNKGFQQRNKSPQPINHNVVSASPTDGLSDHQLDMSNSVNTYNASSNNSLFSTNTSRSAHLSQPKQDTNQAPIRAQNQTQNQTRNQPQNLVPNQNSLLNDFNELEFNLNMNMIMNDDLMDPLSPSSDTACDWVDKHMFEFDAYNLAPDVPK